MKIFIIVFFLFIHTIFSFSQETQTKYSKASYAINGKIGAANLITNYAGTLNGNVASFEVLLEHHIKKSWVFKTGLNYSIFTSNGVDKENKSFFIGNHYAGVPLAIGWKMEHFELNESIRLFPYQSLGLLPRLLVASHIRYTQDNKSKTHTFEGFNLGGFYELGFFLEFHRKSYIGVTMLNILDFNSAKRNERKSKLMNHNVINMSFAYHLKKKKKI